MFVAHELTAEVSFPVAERRLGSLVQGGWLGMASGDAYQDGFTIVIRVGPFGDRPGASKRVHVQFLDPVHHGEAMTVGVRWQATGITGALFPVLDADISLTPAGAEATRLALAGTYRPPLDGVGATLDEVILHRVAAATIRTLLERVAAALTSPAPAPAEAIPKDRLYDTDRIISRTPAYATVTGLLVSVSAGLVQSLPRSAAPSPVRPPSGTAAAQPVSCCRHAATKIKRPDHPLAIRPLTCTSW